MKPFQASLVWEEAGLADKIYNLTNFIHAPTFGSLTAAEQERLTRQLDLMRKYAAVLRERITASAS